MNSSFYFTQLLQYRFPSLILQSVYSSVYTKGTGLTYTWSGTSQYIMPNKFWAFSSKHNNNNNNKNFNWKIYLFSSLLLHYISLIYITFQNIPLFFIASTLHISYIHYISKYTSFLHCLIQWQHQQQPATPQMPPGNYLLHLRVD